MRLKTIFASLMVVLLSGCASSFPVGGLYTDLKLPMDAESAAGSTKVGEAECSSILSLVATGDCSIDTAMKNGGLSEVHHVDWYANNILGIIGNYKIIVYGN